MLIICSNLDKVPAKLLTGEKFIGGGAHTLDIFFDLMGGGSRIHLANASLALTPTEVFLTRAELKPEFGMY